MPKRMDRLLFNWDPPKGANSGKRLADLFWPIIPSRHFSR